MTGIPIATSWVKGVPKWRDRCIRLQGTNRGK